MSAGLRRQSARQLGLLGGPPAFTHPLHVGRPNIGDRAVLQRRMNDLLDRRSLSNDGTYVRQFEEAVAQAVGVRHCVATCNATIALMLTIRALELEGEVIVPAFTFIATVHALQWQQVTPVFCDIDPVTMNMDPALVEALITDRTTAILPVHLWGQGCDVAEFERIADRHGLKLLFDAAHAFACTVAGRPVGSFGNAEILSFHATKVVNSFEGGAVVTNDQALAARLHLMRNYGFADVDLVTEIGVNGKMSEASAAMGLTSLESADAFIRVNRRNFALYDEALRGLPGVSILKPDAHGASNFQYVVLRIAPESGISRDTLHAVLQAENVMARRYFTPGAHRMEPYRSMTRYAGLSLPETELACEQALCLPTGTAVALEEILCICEIIRNAIEHGDALRAAISG